MNTKNPALPPFRRNIDATRVARTVEVHRDSRFMSSGQYYIQDGYIYGPKMSGRFYIQDGYIYGPKNSGRYYIQGNYIYGPKKSGRFYIQNNYIYGPNEELPWLED